LDDHWHLPADANLPDFDCAGFPALNIRHVDSLPATGRWAKETVAGMVQHNARFNLVMREFYAKWCRTSQFALIVCTTIVMKLSAGCAVAVILDAAVKKNDPPFKTTLR
jgi:hypothetical protein